MAAPSKNYNSLEKIQRANITDRNGTFLAKTVNSIDIGINPLDIINKEKLLINLKYIFPNKDYDLIRLRLEKNKFFDTYWIQNFNLNQEIPLDNGSVDCCLMVAAWQYLQYPENLTREIARILSNQGKFIIAFSNRAFWHKAPNIWTTSSDEERVKYVRKVLITNGFNEPKIIKKFKQSSLRFFNFLNKDPFYCLIATKD